MMVLKVGWLEDAGAKKPKPASMADEEGVAEKVVVKPLVDEKGKLTR